MRFDYIQDAVTGDYVVVDTLMEKELYRTQSAQQATTVLKLYHALERRYPYSDRNGTIWGYYSSISRSGNSGYHVYGGPHKYRYYKTYRYAWKAFCRNNGYQTDVTVLTSDGLTPGKRG